MRKIFFIGSVSVFEIQVFFSPTLSGTNRFLRGSAAFLASPDHESEPETRRNIMAGPLGLDVQALITCWPTANLFARNVNSGPIVGYLISGTWVHPAEDTYESEVQNSGMEMNPLAYGMDACHCFGWISQSSTPTLAHLETPTQHHAMPRPESFKI